MPRPKRCRRVCCEPGYTYFKPQGIPLERLEKRELGLDELEAIRLADMLGLPQAEAARMMNISQPTFSRIVSNGRQKIAECVVRGLALKMKSVESSNSVIDREESMTPPKGRCNRRRGR
jgi:predicted DNA-binding protein (UPF0251 family)